MQSELDFLKNHQGADLITVRADSGEPVKATYSTIHGEPRKHVAEYWYPEY